MISISNVRQSMEFPNQSARNVASLFFTISIVNFKELLTIYNQLYPITTLLPWQCDLARAGDFQHAEGIHQFQKLLHLALVAGDFNRQRLRLHVHDFCAE